jgi:hypothetical protein
MARRFKRSGSRGMLGSAGSLVKQAGMGLFGAMVLGSLVGKFAPQYTQIGSMVGAYLGGGIVGVAGQLLISGVPSLSASTTSNW